jgi:hypothetical protein
MPLVFAVMLRSHGAADYQPVGNRELETAPARGTAIAFDRDGRTVRGTVAAIFIPPGCEENCIGTVFVSEG